MKNTDNIYNQMFAHAETLSFEDFTDEEVALEGICVPELTEQQVAQEGIVTAIAGDIVRNVTDAYKEMKGWTLGIESKRKYINEMCGDTIEWLKDEDRSNKNLELDMGRFKTFMKSSETFYWRFYFVLHDGTYNDIMAAIKKNEITKLEVLSDFNIKERMAVTQKLDSAMTIKDLIVLMEKYRSRCNAIFEGLLKRKRIIQSFPFQILLLGQNDLSRTCKKIVNLAT